MKQDKYLGYWLIKGTKNFIKVIGKCDFPRWRRVKKFYCILGKYIEASPFETSNIETVDYLRLDCEKVTENTFKEYTKGKL